MSTSSGSASMSKAAANSARIDTLKRLLLEEARRKSIHSPLTCVPRNDYDEVLENCFLSNSYVYTKHFSNYLRMFL
jgi:hypothetical protein